MSSPRREFVKCATTSCCRHVHGNARNIGFVFCRACTEIRRNLRNPRRMLARASSNDARALGRYVGEFIIDRLTGIR